MYGSIPEDWLEYSKEQLDPYMMPFNVKKYERYKLCKSILNNEQHVRRDAIIRLQDEEEKKRESVVLSRLHNICLGLEPNQYDFRFSDTFRESANHEH